MSQTRHLNRFQLFIVNWISIESRIMTFIPLPPDAHKYGILFVFAAGVLWSTVGLGIRMIEDAVVWQILLY